MVDAKARTVREEVFPTTDSGLERLAKIVANAECVLEACSTSFPVYDSLIERGVKVKVAHPLALKTISGVKKTDKVDAKKMSLMLKAGVIPEAYIPTKPVRIARDLVKQHISLVQQHTREINKTRAVLLRYRIKPKSKNLFDKKASWIDTCEISAEQKAVLGQYLDSIHQLEKQLKQIDELIVLRAKNNEDTVLLYSIPGVGWFTAYLVAVAINGIKRFPSSEQLVSYAGLAPIVNQSGKTLHMGRISKQGRKELRWALEQCAWVAIRHSKRFRKKFLKLKKKHGEKKAITAVARKLLVIMYTLLKKRETYQEDA